MAWGIVSALVVYVVVYLLLHRKRLPFGAFIPLQLVPKGYYEISAISKIKVPYQSVNQDGSPKEVAIDALLAVLTRGSFSGKTEVYPVLLAEADRYDSLKGISYVDVVDLNGNILLQYSVPGGFGSKDFCRALKSF